MCSIYEDYIYKIIIHFVSQLNYDFTPTLTLTF